MTSTSRVLGSTAQYHPLFNDEDADTIISSIDNILFCLRSVTLKAASGYFEEVFATESTRPDIYRLPFPAKPLEHVFLMINSLPFARPSEINEIEDIIEVMLYLRTEGPLDTFRYRVLSACCDQPIKLYALGARLGWPEIEARGAELSLPLRILWTEEKSYDEDFARMPNPVLLKLLRLHLHRREHFRQGLRIPSKFACQNCWRTKGDGLWKALEHRLVEAMDWDCSGADILGSPIEGWPEAIHCWDTNWCGVLQCRGPFQKAHTLVAIRRIVASLPKSVQD